MDDWMVLMERSRITFPLNGTVVMRTQPGSEDDISLASLWALAEGTTKPTRQERRKENRTIHGVSAPKNAK